MGKREWLTSLLVAWGAALILAAPAAGWGGVDPSFGEQGLVRLDPNLPGYSFQSVERMAVGPGGGIYLLEAPLNCTSSGCAWDLHLTRRKPDGSSDGTYAGGRGAQLVFAGAAGPRAELAVDHRGRAVVGVPEPGGLFLARLRPDGSFDDTFGDRGRVAISCGCEPGFALVRTDKTGRIYLALGVMETPPDFPNDPTSQLRVLIARLAPNGSLDAGFGEGGWSEVRLANAHGPEQMVVRRGGSLLLSGSYRCCNPAEGIFLLQIGRNGGVDRSFAAQVGAELRGLDLDDSSAFTWPVSMLVRRRGAVDVFGNAHGGGFVLRFRRDGSLAPRFGADGRQSLSWFIKAIARLKDGRVMVAGNELSVPGLSVFGLEADGSLDRSYAGGKPTYLPDWGGSSVMMAAQRGSRALLFESGLQECRGYCPPEPKLQRFRSPWDRG